MPRVCLVLIALCALARTDELKLIPTPQQVTPQDGRFEWSSQVKVSLADPTREDDRFAVSQLDDELSLSLGLQRAAAAAGPAEVLVGLLSDAALQPQLAGLDLAPLRSRGPEAYLLLVEPQRILAVGNGPAGTFYAIQTLKQLLRANATRAADGAPTIPCLRILDWPGLTYRGYSDDISRGPIPTMEFFKREIRTMSEFKMNMLTFYTEHVFKLKKHPIIAPPDGITADEVRELSAYAQKYHVELVGNFQSFGHFGNILWHPEYANLRETGWIITPAREESYKFLDDVYSEIAPAYASKLFNVNCDETYGLGEGPSKPMVEKIGVGGVYVQHMNRLHDMLKGKYGKRMMMWGDIALQHPEIVRNLAKDTILLSWGYGAAANYDGAIQPFVKAGLDFMVCPGVSCWSQIFPRYSNAVVNIRNYVRDGARFGALGMLNTTWDDDGENLFHWNFYGTNWGAQCAWRPTNSEIEAYDAAYAQVSYGAADDKITRAIRLLSDCDRNALTQGNSDSAFWVRPFRALATSFDSVIRLATDLCDKTTEAMNLLAAAKAEVRTDAEDLDYLLFAARRLHTIGRSQVLYLWSARMYGEALAAFPDTRPTRDALDFACASAEEMVVTLEELRDEYQRLWLLENRPWWLKEMRGRYDAMLGDLNAYSDRLAKAKKEFEKTGTPPDPAAIGLQLVETSRRSSKTVPAAGDLLPADTPWWDARWPYRIPLRVDNADTERTDACIEARVSFGEQKPDPRSLRVVPVGQTAGGLEALLTQFDPAGPTCGTVAFIVPGKLGPKESRTFAVYYDLAGGPAKPAQGPAGLTVKSEGRWKWVENERYRVLVGPSGAHLFEWYVKALGNLQITQPGRVGWDGFADSGWDRDAHFDLTVECAGPVVARIKASSPPVGSEKLLTFYAGSPFVEVTLGSPVGFYWDYDNVDNFAQDKGHPGTAIFANGHSEAVCRADETVHAVAQGVTWGAKRRDDGLVLANITPEVAATHMVGPGGGWGGVGIESSPVAAHFVTFADKLAGDPGPILNAVAQTLDMRNQPKLWIGRVQTRP